MTRQRLIHPVVAARRATRRRLESPERSGDAGFTLIELLIVVVILPVVMGGIAAALLSVFGLSTQTTNRIGDSNDSLVASANFNKDVQSAQQIETTTIPACGPSTQTQVLGLEWGQDANGVYQTVVSYSTTPNGTTTALVRQLCSSGASATPTSTTYVARDVNSPTVTFNPAGFVAANASWKSTQGLFGVTISITAPGSKYPYSLSGLPSASSSSGSVSQLVQAPNPAGCNTASPTSGTYAKILCFADFTSFTDPSSACQQMKLAIANSPDYLQFCIIATPTNSVRPQAIPTYYSPGTGPNSEAYLGNNGFYTGVAGLPALSQRPQTIPPNTLTFGGANHVETTISFTNIQVTNAVGQPATGWTVVTGDAESTDTNGYLLFQNSNVNWNILPNTASSLWGNSCYDSADPGTIGAYAWSGPVPPTLAQLGTPSSGPPSATLATQLNPAALTSANNYATNASAILCESDSQLNKTGSMMVAAPEPAGSSAPQNVTVTLGGEPPNGDSYQAIFLGVLLS